MNILCATDFSPPARAAADLAIGLARLTGGKLTLLHVVDVSSLFELGLELGTGSWERTMREAVLRELDLEAQRLADAGVPITTEVEIGAVPDRIRARADEARADLIVVGNHGRRGAAHFFVGSVAEDLARTSARPVVVTRGLPYPEAGLSGEGRLQVAVLADGTPAAEAALAWVKALRRRCPCDVTFVQVYREQEEEARLGLEPPRSATAAYQPELRPTLERELRRWVGGLPGEGEVHFRLREQIRPGTDELAIEVELLQPDLVVVGVSQRRLAVEGMLTAPAALRTLKLPVVCVPESMRPPSSNRIPVIRTVVVGTDLSDFADQAVPAAYALLSAGGGRVEVVHVFETGSRADPGPLVGGLVPAPRLDAQRRAEIEAHLAALVPPEAAALGISTRLAVVEAAGAVPGLVREAERSDADVLVVASHGRTGVRRAILGSVAVELMGATGRAVLVLRPPPR